MLGIASREADVVCNLPRALPKWQLSALEAQTDRGRTRPDLLVWGGAPRRNRTGDPILTMDRRLSAVLTDVFAGRLVP